MGEDNTRGAWWHGPLIGGLMTIGTTAAGFIATHWGGVTTDELSKTEKRIVERLSESMSKSDQAHAKDVDDLRRYIDAKTTPAVVPKAKKRKTGEQREQ